ncbi:MAG TPA: RNase adapter RapZ [Acidimicrobiales bacterium]|nr:RNase adapter RapZ [Acidimicrobiales bacterium]
MSDFLVITGMSGAGRSTAAAALEDAGWYVIDNMPPSLLIEVADVVGGPGSTHERVALVLGRARGAGVAEALPAVEDLRARGHRVRIVYLDAPQDVLVRRYEGTRRRHPIAERQVAEAIADERRLLEPMREQADVVVDTAELNVNQLRQRVTELFGDDDESGMRTSVVSFGYKHGLPLDADVVLDCRFLPNPHWVEKLRPLSGLDEPVRDYVLSQDATHDFLDRVEDLVGTLLPAFAEEGKAYLTVALGCTGGRHRSVVLADELARRLAARGASPIVIHRDIER